MIEFPKPDVEQFFKLMAFVPLELAQTSHGSCSARLNGKFNLWAMELEGRPTLIRLHTMTRSQALSSWTRKGDIS